MNFRLFQVSAPVMDRPRSVIMLMSFNRIVFIIGYIIEHHYKIVPLNVIILKLLYRLLKKVN